MDTTQNPMPTEGTQDPMPPITPPEAKPLLMQHVHPFVAWSAVLSMFYFAMMPVVNFM